MMKKTLLFAFLMLSIAKSYPCDCSEKPSVKENWNRAREVFTGKIVSVDSTLYGNNGAKIYSYNVEILKSFKMDFYKERPMRTLISQDYASCDFMFTVGKEYLIYASVEDQTLHSSICSRTSLIEDVDHSELIELDKLYKAYISDVNAIHIVKLEKNVPYQVGLVTAAYDEKIKQQTMIIYALSGFIIAMLIIILIIRMKKNVRGNNS